MFITLIIIQQKTNYNKSLKHCETYFFLLHNIIRNYLSKNYFKRKQIILGKIFLILNIHVS